MNLVAVVIMQTAHGLGLRTGPESHDLLGGT